MPIVWRLVKTRLAASAFDGEGARRYGGRWNSPGLSVAYASETISLAMLEVMVHLRTGEILPSYSRISAEIPDGLVRAISPGSLPPNWKVYPAPAETAAIGDAWVRTGSTPVLMVPSVVVETEHNFLLNPAHPDFGRITIGAPQPFPFDVRLKK